MGKVCGPLTGVKVLDFTRVYSGPYCTMMLADLGAEVIKIEVPGRGDDTRFFLPFKNDESGYYMYLNRNKKGITLDLKSEKGKQIALKLAKWADIVVENFSPGTMEKLGLSYEDIRKVNPQVIYGSISGFGQTGPYRNKVAYDAVAQAMGGLTYITGYPDKPPVKVGSSIADANAGIHMAFGLMAALYFREKTGIGQYVDVSMMDAVFSILENFVVTYTLNGVVPQRIGNENLASAPFDAYETKDDYVVIATANDNLFHKLAKAIGREDLITDPRFITNYQRKQNYKDLKGIITDWTKQYTTMEVVEILDQAKVPVAPILSMDKLVNDPQIKAREMLVDFEHPIAGKITVPGNPVKLSTTPGKMRSAAPVLGQHTEEVLQEVLGLSPQEIAELRETKVI